MNKQYLFFFAVAFGICSAEMPQSPNYEELCESADIIVKASFVSSQKEKIKIGYGVYHRGVFEIDKYYKGTSDNRDISVYIPIDYDWDCHLPNYQKGGMYFLFLRKHDNDFIRTKIDNVWEERLYSPKVEMLIENEIKEEAAPNRWLQKEDNLTYRIPEDANAIEVALSIYQFGRYLKVVKYYKHGEVIGERGWHRNGIMAYEQPYKDGFQHGISRGWNEDGSLVGLSCYRKDRYHGYVLRWTDTANVDISLWVRGKYVSKKEYLEQYKNNATLPKFTLRESAE